MSFSSETKDALARIPFSHTECALAELVPALSMSGTVSLLGGGRMGLHITTEHAPTARRLIRLMRLRFGIKPELRTLRRERLGGRNAYRLSLAGEEAITVLTTCGVLRHDGEGRSFLRPAIPKKALAKGCCRRAFLRGAFLAGGSLSNPEKEYHLEFVARDPRFGAALCALLAKFGLSAKMVRRKAAVVVYLKEAEHIATLLNLIGAHGALLTLENVRIHKELRNNVNRVVNCDSANLGKTVDAASRQIEAIERIRDRAGFDRLPATLRQIAEARLEHREASLQELGALLDPPVGKSGVNHRLRRLIAYAEGLSRE
ncbi:MAG: DNA-binding protein WhiA [Clostridia bacterium]|nr:DNA-binding protein WhiA [Clostridia bacterium]